MLKKNIEIKASLIFLIIIISPLIMAEDSQLFMSCGGDVEMNTGCSFGDDQNSFNGLQIPILNIVYPQNITYNSTIAPNLNYTIDFPSGECWYSKDRGVTNSSAISAGINFTGVTSVEGDNRWDLYCNNNLTGRS